MEAGRKPGLFVIQEEETEKPIMAMAITKTNLFRPVTRISATTRAGMTDLAVRSILEEEANRREAKTALLRKARLEQEAQIASRLLHVTPSRKIKAVRV